MGASAIEDLLRDKRVIVTAGAGGVGKTTTAAALSVAAAQRGRRVLCLTIDPAKRLAESLGLGTLSGEAAEVDRARFEAAGLRLEGSLTAMMLDTKRTFDELVTKHSSSPAKAQKLLENKLYQYVSKELAGTQEYMAMEKLVVVKSDPRYDLVVLDTPPTANALDFLDAPDRLVEAIDSPAMKWFVEAFQSSGKLSLNLLAKTASLALQTLGKITSSGFLAALAEFIVELNDLFGGFRERARRTKEVLSGSDVAFVLVTSPSTDNVREIAFFAEKLAEHRMPQGAFVVNRVRTAPARVGEALPEAEGQARAVALGVVADDDLGARLAEAHADQSRLAAHDAKGVALLTSLAGTTPLVRVRELDTDVHDLDRLAEVGEVLVAGGNA